MKKSKTNLILIVSIFVALFSIAAFIFFFKVIANKNEHTSRVLLTLNEKINNKKNSEVLMAKFTEFESIKNKINNYLVDQSKIDTFVGYLEKLGIANNTELIVKNIEVSTNNKKAITVKLSVSGNFTNVMKVVYLIENIPYHVSLTQAFINKNINNSNTEVIDNKNEITNSTWQADVSFDILSL